MISVNYSGDPIFKDKKGILFPAFEPAIWKELITELTQDYGVTLGQIVEAASYSMAMVVRYALGLSSSGGKIGVLVSDSLAGWTALACFRHLFNSGANGFVMTMEQSSSPELELQLKPLRKMGVEISKLPDKVELEDDFCQQIGSCHNILCGLFGKGTELTDLLTKRTDLIEALNDLATPIHCVIAPPGVNVTEGSSAASPIYASSTLSLGCPLSGLFAANDMVGRHYLCDISIPSDSYKKAGFDLSPLFCEQPVIQIFAAEPEQAEQAE